MGVLEALHRLLDHLDSECGERRQDALEQVAGPRLIRIDRDACCGMFLAHPAHDIHMALSVALELEQGVLAGGPRFAARIRFVPQPECEHGGERTQRRERGLAPGGDTGLLGAEVPKRAVDGVAGPAGGEQLLHGLQRGVVHHIAGRCGHHQRQHGLDLRLQHVRRFAVVVHPGRFGAADVARAIRERERDQWNRRHHAAGDFERFNEVPLFDGNGAGDHRPLRRRNRNPSHTRHHPASGPPRRYP